MIFLRSLLLTVFLIALTKNSYCQAPSNDNCVNAINLCPNVIVNASNQFATLECKAADGGCGGSTGWLPCYSENNTIWFKFITNGSGGSVKITFSNVTSLGSGNDTLQASLISATSPCNSGSYTLIKCLPKIYGGTSTLSSNSLLPNTTYWVQVDGHYIISSAAESGFDIVVSGPAVEQELTVSKVNAKCNENNGEIQVTLSPGGTGPFEYSLNGDTTQSIASFNNLPEGTYTILVKDKTGCELTSTVTLINSTGPSVQSVSATETACSTSDGSITVALNSTFNPPYSFALNDDPPVNSQTFTNLAPGIYTVVVTDANQCDTTLFITVPAINNIQWALPSGNNADCGTQNGTISNLSIMGGSGNFNFSLNGGPLQSDSIFTNLAAGSYNLEIIDPANANCKYTIFNYWIETNPGPQDALVVGTEETCSNKDGTITFSNVKGGVRPYSFSCSGCNGVANDSIFTGLSAGIYNITISDINGCNVIKTVMLNSNKPNGLEPFMTYVKCNKNLGSIDSIAVNGGTSPYYFSVSGNANFQNLPITNIPSGSFTIYVQDGNGCMFNQQVVMPNDGNVQCSAGSNSIITLGESALLQGSNSPGSVYSWSPSETISTPYELQTVATPTETTNYTFTTVSAENCICSSSVLVEVKQIIKPYTVFTPNDDGINDLWKIRFIDFFENCDVKVYTRWGQKVFHQKGYKEGNEWNGTNEGLSLPAATYYYVIDLGIKSEDGKEILYTGAITIVK